MNLELELEAIVGEDGVQRCDALAGTPVAAPADEAQASALLGIARARELRVKLLGFGSKLNWSAAIAGTDFALSTRRLRGISEFEPGDGTITALAGTPMSELRAATAASNLELTPDVPRPERATLGGVLAAGASGPDRTRHGAMRMHVLGTRTLLASGELTKSGGRLVKNVTGYDLHRLYCGSHGSLALILEASLRLSPAPQARRVLHYDFEDLESGIAFAHSIPSQRVMPRCLTLLNSMGTSAWSVELELAGRASQLELETQRLAALRLPIERFEGAAALERSGQVRDAEPDASAQAVLHLSSRPSHLSAACGALFAALDGLPHGRVVLQPAVATLDMSLEAGSLTTEQLNAAREALAPLEARLSLRAPNLQAASTGSAATGGARHPLMQRLRESYDPQHLFAGGAL